MRALRWAAFAAWLTSVSCQGSEAPNTPSPPPSTSTAEDSGTTGPQPLTLDDLAGTWRGSIGVDYTSGCLCLTLDEGGNVIGPSGITLGFQVTSAGDNPDTTLLDPDARLVSVHMLVSGSGFWIEEATVEADASGLAGGWRGDTPSAFDGVITLDREPESCQERTGLYGAPC